MCGLVGFTKSAGVNTRQTLIELCGTIRHRGPDSMGLWYTSDDVVALGHQRLSIQDLSPAGAQPMVSHCGRYVLAFNGEIYNHNSLRREISSEVIGDWRGHSDTETLLACFSAWGVERTLRSAVGMFAVALWDRVAKKLTLARDRLGEKPLYWGWCDDVFLFGSELKAISSHPSFQAEIDRDSLCLLLRHCYIPAPYTIYKGFEKLKPGHFLTLPLHAPKEEIERVQPQAYWTLAEDAINAGTANPFVGNIDEASFRLEQILSESISGQMLADVPLGAFLSGGVDSSTVVALMQAQSRRPIKTFTIGFDERGYDEAVYAREVAKHLKTEHTELFVTPDDAVSVIPDLSHMYCEPFGDSSQIPTFLVSKLAREHVAVALSGDGGDELFGGYNRYLAAKRVWGRVNHLPQGVRRMGSNVLRSISPSTWNYLFEILRPVLPKALRLSTPGEKARKLSDVLELSDGYAFYRQLTSHWTDPAGIVIGATESQSIISDSSAWPRTDSLEHSMMAIDALTYMPDDILTKIDRASMAVSLEARVPMLDHRVVEFAWRLPLEYKIRHGKGKWILRDILYRHVPKRLIERPKMGFGIPLDAWLRGPLRDWAEALLDEQRLRREGFFEPGPIRTVWKEHLSGRNDWQYHLWNILMFQSWLEGNHQS